MGKYFMKPGTKVNWDTGGSGIREFILLAPLPEAKKGGGPSPYILIAEREGQRVTFHCFSAPPTVRLEKQGPRAVVDFTDQNRTFFWIGDIVEFDGNEYILESGVHYLFDEEGKFKKDEKKE
ncbi:MAG: hypothetical protein ACYTHN_18560 [Planctomycetota bacterium]